MRQAAIAGACFGLAAFLVPAGCIDDVAANRAWHVCKNDPCSNTCEPDLRAKYCGYYVDDPKCDRCWNGAAADAGQDGYRGDAQAGACSRSTDCPVDAPRCAGEKCGACTGDADCSGRDETPACDPISGACVECTAANQTLCAATERVCKDTSGECVGCNSHDDCSESAPVCGENNECGACTEDADCAKYGTVCDTEGGECVQCTGKKAQLCDGSVCDSKARTCANGVLPQSAGLCEACMSDDHCGKGGVAALCLPTSFGGQDTGYFCQAKLAAGESCIDNHRPFVAEALDPQSSPLESIDGAMDASCTLARTTCAALEDFGIKKCGEAANSAACGVPGLDDGICSPVQSTYRCSVPCGTSDDCNEGFACPLGGGACSL